MDALITFDLEQNGNRAEAEKYLLSMGFTNHALADAGVPFRLPSTTWLGQIRVTPQQFRDALWADFLAKGCQPTRMLVTEAANSAARGRF